MSSEKFDTSCRRCSRIGDFLDQIKAQHPSYHCAPVPPFGDPNARFLLVGLAPGMHGANATGRPFTGDHAGILLYQTLYRFGFSSRPESVDSKDGLSLIDCRITNAVKCLPPANKPTGLETRTCNPFLASELRDLPQGAVILALGGLAHGAVLRALDLRASEYRFGHGAVFPLEGLTLIDSYHCSRYNTNTRRLTAEMFEAVFRQVRRCLAG